MFKAFHNAISPAKLRKISEPKPFGFLFVLEDCRIVQFSQLRAMPFRKLLRIILDGIHDIKECIVLEVHPGSGVGALQATNLHSL
jgi:hypothetical protein